MIDTTKITQYAIAVEQEWQMGGLATGLYLDFVIAVMEKYLADQPPIAGYEVTETLYNDITSEEDKWTSLGVFPDLRDAIATAAAQKQHPCQFGFSREVDILVKLTEQGEPC